MLGVLFLNYSSVLFPPFSANLLKSMISNVLSDVEAYESTPEFEITFGLAVLSIKYTLAMV